VVYFIHKAIDDVFIGGSASNITVTLWFAVASTMALPMFLFY
jgi:hypothetical protein|tara:strand:- start:107 stop:232 length:126 start_codon:yes stop_codon:yes gene_type:complete